MGATSFSVTDTQLWPSLARTLEDLSRHKAHVRETVGADVFPRTLDRMNGMERTGAEPIRQRLFGGIVAGDGMDQVASGAFVPRDAMWMNTDANRGMLTLHLGIGLVLDSQA